MATALLVLDMLTDFTSGKLANPAASQITDPIAELIQAARLRDDWIVVYGNDAHRPGDFELSVFGEHAMADSPGAAVIEELAPLPGDIIVPKRYYSAFTETDLDATCRVPFAAGRYAEAQEDALRYLRTYYGAEITSTSSLV